MVPETNLFVELLDRFMRGEASPEQEEALRAWFRQRDRLDELQFFYRRKWDESDGLPLSAETQGRMFRRIQTCMEEGGMRRNDKAKKRFDLPPHFRRWLSWAAAVWVVLGLGMTVLFYRQGADVSTPARYVVSAEKGQRANVVLPDGTNVWLNSHTQLIYDSSYGDKERSVILSGEAYFEVAKDPAHRFVVKTGGLEVEALGTSFNVKAYREDAEWTATLFDGSIRAAAGGRTAVLEPRQHVRFDQAKGRMWVEQPEHVFYARLWRKNELAFSNETLEDMAVLLNRMYNVEVRFKSEKIKKYRFSGVIRNNSLENVFEIISLTAPITYETAGDTVVLDEKCSAGYSP